jgi:catechol 2,3-dioxygenase-like lactoylglutathione lyase family enzyme
MEVSVPLSFLGKGLEQVAFVVRSLEAGQRFFNEQMGVPRFYVIEDFGSRATEKTFRGRPANHHFKIAIAYSGNTQIELIEHVAGETTYKEFLERRGEGMHHLGFFFDDRQRYDNIFSEFAPKYSVLQSGRFGETIYTYFDTEAAIGAVMEIVYLDPQTKELMARVKRGEF